MKAKKRNMSDGKSVAELEGKPSPNLRGSKDVVVTGGSVIEVLAAAGAVEDVDGFKFVVADSDEEVGRLVGRN